MEQELQGQLEQVCQVNLQQYNLELPQQFLLDYCQSRHILCLDLLPNFKEHGRDGGLYLLQDTHYNIAGNTLGYQRNFQLSKRK